MPLACGVVLLLGGWSFLALATFTDLVSSYPPLAYNSSGPNTLTSPGFLVEYFTKTPDSRQAFQNFQCGGAMTNCPGLAAFETKYARDYLGSPLLRDWVRVTAAVVPSLEFTTSAVANDSVSKLDVSAEEWYGYYLPAKEGVMVSSFGSNQTWGMRISGQIRTYSGLSSRLRVHVQGWCFSYTIKIGNGNTTEYANYDDSAHPINKQEYDLSGNLSQSVLFEIHFRCPNEKTVQYFNIRWAPERWRGPSRVYLSGNLLLGTSNLTAFDQACAASGSSPPTFGEWKALLWTNSTDKVTRFPTGGLVFPLIHKNEQYEYFEVGDLNTRSGGAAGLPVSNNLYGIPQSAADGIWIGDDAGANCASGAAYGMVTTDTSGNNWRVGDVASCTESHRFYCVEVFPSSTPACSSVCNADVVGCAGVCKVDQPCRTDVECETGNCAGGVCKGLNIFARYCINLDCIPQTACATGTCLPWSGYSTFKCVVGGPNFTASEGQTCTGGLYSRPSSARVLLPPGPDPCPPRYNVSSNASSGTTCNYIAGSNCCGPYMPCTSPCNFTSATPRMFLRPGHVLVGPVVIAFNISNATFSWQTCYAACGLALNAECGSFSRVDVNSSHVSCRCSKSRVLAYSVPVPLTTYSWVVLPPNQYEFVPLSPNYMVNTLPTHALSSSAVTQIHTFFKAVSTTAPLFLPTADTQAIDYFCIFTGVQCFNTASDTMTGPGEIADGFSLMLPLWNLRSSSPTPVTLTIPTGLIHFDLSHNFNLPLLLFASLPASLKSVELLGMAPAQIAGSGWDTTAVIVPARWSEPDDGFLWQKINFHNFSKLQHFVVHRRRSGVVSTPNLPLTSLVMLSGAFLNQGTIVNVAGAFNISVSAGLQNFITVGTNFVPSILQNQRTTLNRLELHQLPENPTQNTFLELPNQNKLKYLEISTSNYSNTNFSFTQSMASTLTELRVTNVQTPLFSIAPNAFPSLKRLTVSLSRQNALPVSQFFSDIHCCAARTQLREVFLSGTKLFGVLPTGALNFPSMTSISLDSNFLVTDKPVRQFALDATDVQLTTNLNDYLSSWAMLPGWDGTANTTMNLALEDNPLLCGYAPSNTQCTSTNCQLPASMFCGIPSQYPDGTCTQFLLIDYWVASVNTNADIPVVSDRAILPAGQFRVYTVIYGNPASYATLGDSLSQSGILNSAEPLLRTAFSTDLMCALKIPDASMGLGLIKTNLTLSPTPIPNINIGACDFALQRPSFNDNTEYLAGFGVFNPAGMAMFEASQAFGDGTGSSIWPVSILGTQCAPGSCRFNNTCNPCNGGTYSDGGDCPQSPQCASCPAGTASQPGSASCVVCSDGYEANPGGCQPCRNGTYGLSGVCLTCTNAKYVATTQAIACVDCPVGTGSRLDGTDCDPCALGRYRYNETSCTACPLGRYQNQTGQTTCGKCDAGSEAGVGGRACVACQVGYVYNGNLSISSCVACVPGKYQSRPGQLTCADCDAGSFVATEAQAECADCASGYFSLNGTSSCSGCLPGKYQNLTGRSKCEDCEIARYSPQAQSACTDCDVGRFSAYKGKAVCDDCVKGKYNNVTGQSVCLNCTATTYSGSDRQVDCTPCPEGHFGIELGLSACSPCTPHTFQNKIGQLLCLECDPGMDATGTAAVNCTPCNPGRAGKNCAACATGTFQSQEGKTTCDDCQIGKYTNAPVGESGATSCSDCPVGRYGTSPPKNLSSCVPCAANSTSKLGTASRDLCTCMAGTYGSAINHSDPVCIPCPGCAVCPGGALPTSPAGCFLLSPNDTLGSVGLTIYTAITCSPLDACLADSKCSLPYKGTLCHSCATNYYRVDGNCLQCPDTAGAFWVLMILLLFAITLVLLRFSRPNLSKINSVGIFLSGVQIISVFGSLPIDYPDATKAMFKALSAANFNLDLFSPECSTKMRFYGLWMFKLALPFFFAFALGVIYLLMHYVPKFRKIFYKMMGDVDPTERGKSRPSRMTASTTTGALDESEIHWASGGEESAVNMQEYVPSDIDRFVYCIVSLVTLLYTFLASTSSQPFQCIPVGPTYVLYKDASELCYTDEWKGYAALGGIAMAFYIVGFPATLLYLLVKGNSQNRVSEPDFLARFGSLVVAYRSQFFFWEIVDMLRKAGVVLCIAFLPSTSDGDKALQINLIFLLTFAFLLAQVMTNPFEYNFCNRLCFVWLTTTLLTLVSALLFHSPGLADRDRFAYAVFLLIVVLFATGVTIYVAIREIRRAYWRSTMEKRTGVTTLSRRKLQRDLLGQIFEGFSHDVWRKMRIYNDEESLKFFHYLARNVKPAIAKDSSSGMTRNTMVNGVLAPKPQRLPSTKNLMSADDLAESDRVAQQGAIELARVTPNVAAG